MLRACCDKYGYGGVTIRNFVYCDKSVGYQIVFCKQNCVQSAVKIVNVIPITCNHSKIGIINAGFPLAMLIPCPVASIPIVVLHV